MFCKKCTDSNVGVNPPLVDEIFQQKIRLSLLLGEKETIDKSEPFIDSSKINSYLATDYSDNMNGVCCRADRKHTNSRKNVARSCVAPSARRSPGKKYE